MTKHALALLLTAPLWLSAESFAQTASKDAPAPSRWSLGLGAAVFSGVYAGEGAHATPVPLVAYQGERLYWRGISGGYNLLEQDSFKLEATLSLRLDGMRVRDFGRRELRDHGIDRDLLSNRYDGIDLGLSGTLSGWAGDLEIAVKRDVTGASEGIETSLKFGHAFEWAGTSITPFIGLSHFGKKMANYYYGTLDEEVRRGVVDYKPGSFNAVEIGVDATRVIDGPWSLIGNATFRALPDQVSNSPLVKDGTKGVSSVFLGVLYGF